MCAGVNVYAMCSHTWSRNDKVNSAKYRPSVNSGKGHIGVSYILIATFL